MALRSSWALWLSESQPVAARALLVTCLPWESTTDLFVLVSDQPKANAKLPGQISHQPLAQTTGEAVLAELCSFAGFRWLR